MNQNSDLNSMDSSTKITEVEQIEAFDWRNDNLNLNQSNPLSMPPNATNYHFNSIISRTLVFFSFQSFLN